MQARYPGWAVVGICAVASLWLGSRAFEAPTLPIAHHALPAQLAATRDGDARISYRPGHYPQLRLPDGEIHSVRSILSVAHPLAFGEYVWNTEGVPQGSVWMRIDLARQMLSVFRGGDEIGTAVVIYGTKAKPTPVGLFHILEKSQNYYSKSYDAPMPYTLRLTADGVALHASSVRELSATHGCIGLPMGFARLLFAAASQGDEVEILPAAHGA
jgi:lipoprotein-anchoring transpeptidase ErfK/SrfK